MIAVSSSCIHVVVVDWDFYPFVLLRQGLDRKRIVGMRYITIPAPYIPAWGETPSVQQEI
jgi:hypothetical protein